MACFMGEQDGGIADSAYMMKRLCFAF